MLNLLEIAPFDCLNDSPPLSDYDNGGQGDMTPEEAENALKDWGFYNAKVDEFKAYRRRTVLSLYRRKGWKALGFSTPEAFAEERLHLGKSVFWSIISCAEIEAEIVSEISDIEKENLKDSAFNTLKTYAKKDRLRLVKELRKRRAPIKAKTLKELAETLEIAPNAAPTPLPFSAFSNPQPAPPSGGTYTVELTAEEREELWQVCAQLSAECGQGVTPVQAIKKLIQAAGQQAKRPAEKIHTDDPIRANFSEEDFCPETESIPEPPAAAETLPVPTPEPSPPAALPPLPEGKIITEQTVLSVGDTVFWFGKWCPIVQIEDDFLTIDQGFPTKFPRSMFTGERYKSAELFGT